MEADDGRGFGLVSELGTPLRRCSADRDTNVVESLLYAAATSVAAVVATSAENRQRTGVAVVKSTV